MTFIICDGIGTIVKERDDGYFTGGVLKRDVEENEWHEGFPTLRRIKGDQMFRRMERLKSRIYQKFYIKKV